MNRESPSLRSAGYEPRRTRAELRTHAAAVERKQKHQSLRFGYVQAQQRKKPVMRLQALVITNAGAVSHAPNANTDRSDYPTPHRWREFRTPSRGTAPAERRFVPTAISPDCQCRYRCKSGADARAVVSANASKSEGSTNAGAIWTVLRRGLRLRCSEPALTVRASLQS